MFRCLPGPKRILLRETEGMRSSFYEGEGKEKKRGKKVIPPLKNAGEKRLHGAQKERKKGGGGRLSLPVRKKEKGDLPQGKK